MMEQVNDFVCHRLDHESFSKDRVVRVWFTDLDQQQSDIAQLSWLSKSEQIRAARLKSLLERQRYLAGRVFIRRVLSNLTGVAPENVEIIIDQCGKPCLTLPAVAGHLPSGSLLKFNVSHSENFLCIATALGCDVGVDIEVVNPDLDVLAISEACLDSEDTHRVWCSFPGERSLVFYRRWTQKEAFAKMMGHGVSSDHVHRTPALTWSLGSLEFTLGEKQLVGSLAIGAPRTTLAGVFETIP
jgi:4'-phosphopantetheinyl transferase